MKPTRAAYVRDYYSLVITTTFLGPDRLPRCMSVTGLPDEACARAFLAYMGWADVPFTVI